MIVIICAKYKKNPSRTVDATEWTQISKSRPNDLEHIGQGQWSSHATHPLMLLIICTKYGKNPSWTVDATGWTRKVNRQTDGQTDRQTGWIQYTPPNFVAEGINILIFFLQNWLVNIGSVNGLVPSGNKPLPETILTRFYIITWPLRSYDITMPQGVNPIQWINSLAPGRCDNSFKSAISKGMLEIKFISTSCETALRCMPQNTFVDNSTLVQVMS